MTPQLITRVLPWALVLIAATLFAVVVVSQRHADAARGRVSAIFSFQSALGQQSNLTLTAVSLASLDGGGAA